MGIMGIMGIISLQVRLSTQVNFLIAPATMMWSIGSVTVWWTVARFEVDVHTYVTHIPNM